MSEHYQVFIEEAVVEYIASIRGTEKKELRKFIGSLSKNPYQEGDFKEHDQSGRICFCKIVRDYAVGFYPDHAVKEVKVFEIAKADQ